MSVRHVGLTSVKTTTLITLESTEYRVQSRNYHYLSNYGITSSEFDGLREKCNDTCEICREKGVVLDHCHASGNVRGLICNRCNQALGLMRDNHTFILNLAKYLKNFTDKG